MLKIFRLVVCVCVGLFGGSSAEAGLMLTGNDAAHIALGNQGSNQSVGWVSSSGGRGGFTVIDDGLWGISSYHVTSNDPSRNTFFSNIQMGFGNSLSPSQSTGNFQIFPNLTKDLVLFKFDQPFVGITPLQRFTGFVVNGMEGFTVGYGNLQYVNEATSVYTGDRRAGFDVVDGINLFEPENFRTTIDSPIISTYRLLEMGLRAGDSGGGFIWNNLLAGVNDSGTTRFGFPGFSYYTRLDNEWIDLTIAANSTAIPEPTTLALLIFGGGPFGGVYAAIRARKKKLVV